MGMGVGGGCEHKGKVGGDWSAHSSERRCHWLPYLKEMRRAEEGGNGEEEQKNEWRKRKKGDVISHGCFHKKSPRP